MSTTRNTMAATGLLWLGRGLAVLLALFWGAFFVEHLAEWFSGAGGKYPPPWVWVAQFGHLLMVVGPALMLWRAGIGSAVLAVGTIVFLGVIGSSSLAWVALVNLVPIAVLAAAWWMRRVGPPIGPQAMLRGS